MCIIALYYLVFLFFHFHHHNIVYNCTCTVQMSRTTPLLLQLLYLVIISSISLHALNRITMSIAVLHPMYCIKYTCSLNDDVCARNKRVR